VFFHEIFEKKGANGVIYLWNLLIKKSQSANWIEIIPISVDDGFKLPLICAFSGFSAEKVTFPTSKFEFSKNFSSEFAESEKKLPAFSAFSRHWLFF
jgi:hypothetical protein